MCMYVTILYNYEKAVHMHNYWFFWKILCFNYLISTLYISLTLLFQLYITKAGLIEDNLF